jgi:hypothetical protein
MWFWPFNKAIELVYGMPAPQIRGRIFVSARIEAGLKFKRFLYFVSIDARCFRIPGYPRLKTSLLDNRVTDICEVVSLTRRPPSTSGGFLNCVEHISEYWTVLAYWYAGRQVLYCSHETKHTGTITRIFAHT